MQNDRLDLTVILAGKKFEKMPCIQRFLHFFDHFSSLVLQISLDTVYFDPIFFNKNDREIEPDILHTINQMSSKKSPEIFHVMFVLTLCHIYEVD